MKKIISVLLLMVMVLVMVACSNNDDLIGNWNLYEAEAMGIEILMIITDDQIGVLDDFYDYTIKRKQIILVRDGIEAEVDFEIDGDTLTLGSGDEQQIYIRKED